MSAQNKERSERDRDRERENETQQGRKRRKEKKKEKESEREGERERERWMTNRNTASSINHRCYRVLYRVLARVRLWGISTGCLAEVVMIILICLRVW